MTAQEKPGPVRLNNTISKVERVNEWSAVAGDTHASLDYFANPVASCRHDAIVVQPECLIKILDMS